LDMIGLEDAERGRWMVRCYILGYFSSIGAGRQDHRMQTHISGPFFLLR